MLAALFNGALTETPWYLFSHCLPIMIIGGGVEEAGWQGLLPFPSRFAIF